MTVKVMEGILDKRQTLTRDQKIKRMDRVESRLAEKAAAAWKKAGEDTLKAGVPIAASIDGKVVLIHPDGSKEVIGDVEERVIVSRPLSGRAVWKTKSPASE